MVDPSMDVHACPDKVGIEKADPDLLRGIVSTCRGRSAHKRRGRPASGGPVTGSGARRVSTSGTATGAGSLGSPIHGLSLSAFRPSL